jgi:hypothetical protein
MMSLRYFGPGITAFPWKTRMNGAHLEVLILIITDDDDEELALKVFGTKSLNIIRREVFARLGERTLCHELIRSGAIHRRSQ